MVRLLPEQASADWDFLWPIIVRSLPPIAPKAEGVSKLAFLQAVQMEKAVVWGYYKGELLSGLAVTLVQKDPIFGWKGLLIYSVVAIDSISLAGWRSGINTLKEYAREKGCQSINGYSLQEQYVNLFKRVGAKADWLLIEIEV